MEMKTMGYGLWLRISLLLNSMPDSPGNLAGMWSIPRGAEEDEAEAYWEHWALSTEHPDAGPSTDTPSHLCLCPSPSQYLISTYTLAYTGPAQ